MSYEYEIDNKIVVFKDEKNYLEAKLHYIELKEHLDNLTFLEYFQNDMYQETYNVEEIKDRYVFYSTPILYSDNYYSINANSSNETSFPINYTIGIDFPENDEDWINPLFNITADFSYQGIQKEKIKKYTPFTRFEIMDI